MLTLLSLLAAYSLWLTWHARRTEKKLRGLLMSVDDLILILDDEGTYIEIGQTNRASLLRPKAELLGRRIHEFFEPEKVDFFMATIARVLRERSTIHVDYSVVVNGELKWFTGAVSPISDHRVVWVANDITEHRLSEEARQRALVEQVHDIIRDAGGQLLRIVGTVQDITEKKHAERLLRESEERFRLLAQATNDAVWDLDVESGKVWRGNQYDVLFGYKQGAIAPTVDAWLELVHPDDQSQVEQSYTTAIEAGELSWSAEYRFRRADGSYAHILDRCYIVRDAQKKARRVLGAMMDITERKQMGEQLAQARRVSSLGRIAASIAHEFNNVLMGMEPNLELIRRRAPQDLIKPVNHVMTSVFRGKRITEEILRFTRPAEPQLQSVSLDSLIEGWAAELAPQLGAEIALSIEIEETDVHVSADPFQLAQVLTNLALNARDAMPAGGTCTISVNRPASFSTFEFGVIRTPDRFVHIQVRDTGIGMSRELLAHVFEPLFTTKKRGTGLGLAISYQIVDRHGGMMFAESEPGQGTTFHILLPAMCSAGSCGEGESELAEPAHITLPLRRVLMVEDEEAVGEGIQALFALEGVRVDVVTTGAEAIPAIERFAPDAVVLDIGLPDIDGSELYAQIAARWPFMPVVFSSGHADKAKLEHYLSRPMVELLAKPYSFESLHRTLADLVLTSRRDAA